VTDSARRLRTGGGGWWALAAVGVCQWALLVGANMPSPLYAVYGARFDLSPFTLTALYATYALALIPALLALGPASDVVGRRPVLVAGVVLGAVGAVLFAGADGVGQLFLGRAFQGLAIGAVMGAATAAFIEQHPRADRARATTLSATVALSGTACGPLLGGLLAEVSSAPLVTPYLVALALLAVALVGLLWGLPDDRVRGPRWRPRRPSVPEEIRRPFAAASFSGFLSWGVTGLFLALVPSYVARLLEIDNLVVTGGAVTLMLGAASAVQPLLPRLDSLQAQSLGLGLLLAGLAALSLAAELGSVVVVLVATITSGLGHGLTYGAALSEVTAMSPVHRRGDTAATFTVMGYVGSGLPIVGVGALATGLGLVPAVQVFALVTGAGCLVALASVRRRRRARPRRPPRGRSRGHRRVR
jgi:predicted MFS family arabinose efflux permease